MATTDSVRKDLATRQDQPAGGNGVEKIGADLRGQIVAMRPEFERVITDRAMVDRFLRVALTEIRQNPALMRCTPDSVLGALMTAAQLGLEPGNGLGQAYLVPYRNRQADETVCTFITGYKGLLKLAWQSEQVTSVVAQTVRENDEFDFAYGLEPHLTHKPARANRGDAYAWYAAARIVGGGSVFEVMFREDIERIRTRSRAKDSGPWQTDYDAMARKTVIRQLAKFLPMSTAFELAAANDEAVRTNTTVDQLTAPVYATADAEGAPL
jgi:recombination protein RecT